MEVDPGFAALVSDIRRGGTFGGFRGYVGAGAAFAELLKWELLPNGRREVSATIGRFAQLLDSQADDGAVRWIQEHLPLYLALIPPRRRGQFLQGVRTAGTILRTRPTR